MMRINHRSVVAPALALTFFASALAVMTRWAPLAAGCEGALCSLACDEDDVSAATCPRPLACVGDRCEMRAEACSRGESVEGCVCSPPWVVREGRCVDPFVERICLPSGRMRSVELFAETCEESPSRCLQLLKLDGAELRSILEVAPVRTTQPWDSTIAGLPRVDRWLTEHERSSLYGGEAVVIVVAAPSAPPRRSRGRVVSARAVSEAVSAVIGGATRERTVTLTVPPDEGGRARTLEFPPGTVTLVGFPCLTREELH